MGSSPPGGVWSFPASLPARWSLRHLEPVAGGTAPLPLHRALGTRGPLPLKPPGTSESAQVRPPMHPFPRVTATKYHQPGGLHNRNVLLHSPGSHRSQVKGPAGWISSERCEEVTCP